MDLSQFDIPNPFGLLASDFDHDMDGYRAALGFLGDLSGGTPEERALAINGGNAELLRTWEQSRKFRRVRDRCRQAGVKEREYEGAKQAQRDDPSQWPMLGRLDLRQDPFRVSPGGDARDVLRRFGR